MSAATPGRRKTTNPALLEKHIQEACCQILEYDGWRRIRMEATYSEKKRKGVGEPGMADDLFLRYSPVMIPKGHAAFNPATTVQVMWIEWKRLVPRPERIRRNNTLKQKWPRSTQAAVHQKAWHALERKRGALTLVAGEDFIASVDGFKDWYKASGLMRNKVA
jgi:hypothetical protein